MLFKIKLRNLGEGNIFVQRHALLCYYWKKLAGDTLMASGTYTITCYLTQFRP